MIKESIEEKAEKVVKALDECCSYEITKEDITCYKCKVNETCGYAFDPYNTYGDCIAEK